MDQQPNTEAQKEFVPPSHWMDPEELTAQYWADGEKQEVRGQEFSHKPIETIEMIERMDSKGIARRDFLTIMGASMALTSLSCVRRPVHKIIPYVVKPENVTPGVANWYASTCTACSTGCGTLVKTRESRPIKIEGNPDHPVNHGRLCSRGQASVLNLYDPDRLKGPVAIDSGSAKDITWEEADQKAAAALRNAGRVRVLTGSVMSPSTNRLIGEFLGGFRDGKHLQWEPLGFDDLVKAQELSYGTSGIPNYHFDRADVVVSVSSDFLGTGISPVEHAADWSKKRKPGAGMSEFFCFESTMTVTGANADSRVGIRAGDEIKIVMALLHEVTHKAGNGSYGAYLDGYSPDKVAQDIGGALTADHLRRAAASLWHARGKSLVVAGSLHSRSKDAVAVQVAVNLLNSLLGNDGETVEGAGDVLLAGSSYSDLASLVHELEAGSVDVLVIHGTNPVYALPETEKAIRKAKFVISMNDRVDETGRVAHLVMPDHHSLESWGDVHPRKSVYSIQQPTIAPLHNTRSFQDTLLTWVGALKLNAKLASKIAASEEDKSWNAYLKANWQETLYPQNGRSSGGFQSFWEETLRKGVLTVSVSGTGSARSFKTQAASALPSFQPGKKGIQFAMMESVAIGDGRSSNNAWLMEMPDPVSTVTWDNYLNVAPAMAKSLSLTENDVVEVKFEDGKSFELPVFVQPGMHPETVSAAVGFGRSAVGNVGNGAGVNVFPAARAEKGNLTTSGMTVNLRKTGRRYELAKTQGHHRTEGRPIINDITLAQFRKSPASEAHTNPHLRLKEVPTLWPKHEYKGYRWAMAIDLNSCTGCGSCVIACQAENNVPVVGRDRVRVGREMHWIRIDRYYSGSEENPDTVFQPMLCQHCENASCETVCPVLATVHSSEGLSEQAYNRCVGTRYCQNNCPYKVRRFNFFDHWKDYREPMNQVYNPDVTVRSRGIMEKCSFCVQRIQDAKSTAKDEGRAVSDQHLKTACQQTCPTDAIVFGDINNPESRVSKLAKDARGFKALEIINNKPQVTYLTKVRNKEESEAHGEHH